MNTAISDAEFDAAIAAMDAGPSAQEAREQAARDAMGPPGTLDWAKNIASATIAKLAGDLTLAFGNEFLAACAIIRKRESDFYERVRVRLKQKGVARLSEFDGQVRARQLAADQQERDERKLQQPVAKGSKAAGDTFKLVDPEPSSAVVEGAVLLRDLVKFLERFLILPAGAAVAIALWVVHTYCTAATDVTPRLAILSPQKRCGKSRLLKLLTRLVRRALASSSLTAAATFRIIEQQHPTLIVDEADTFLKDNEELRGVLNSGHERAMAFVLRAVAVGQDWEVRKFATFGPVVIALIGRLSDTLEDRSVMVLMRRRLPTETVEKLKKDGPWTCTADDLASRCARWAQDNLSAFKAADPRVPEELDDRASDNWTPLLAIAERVGGEWPEKARITAVALSGGAAKPADTYGTMLLADLRVYFAESGVAALPSQDICNHLATLEGRPWPESNHGKPISTTQLARFLKPFGVLPGTVRVSAEYAAAQDCGNPECGSKDGRRHCGKSHCGETPKGYKLADLKDAFSRYLPASPDFAATVPQPHGENGFSEFSTRHMENGVAVDKVDSAYAPSGCGDVSAEYGENGPAHEIDPFGEVVK